MKQQLLDLFDRKRASAGTRETIDWNDRRDRYLVAVNELYDLIEQIIGDAIDKSFVRISRRSKELSENYIGTYAVDELLLVIGDEQVRFSPRGRNIAGAAGRVDVVGERAEGVLVVQSDGRWSVVQSRQPTLSVAPLDEDTLTDMLQDVMRK